MTDLVLYDGQCRFCRANVALLKALDLTGRLRYQPLNDPSARAMIVVTAKGRRYSGAESVRYLTRRLPLLWWLAPILHIPGSLPFWRWLYAKVAERRYWFGQLSCVDEVCSLK